MADRKITDLTAIVTPVDADLLTIVDISEGAPADQNKKMLMSKLAPYLLTGITDNYLPKRTVSGTYGQSLIFDNGTNVGIGTATPSPDYPLTVAGAGIYLDSPGNALMIVDRGNTNRSANVVFLTAGATNWSIGTVDSDLYGDGTQFYIGTTIGGTSPAVVIKTTGAITFASTITTNLTANRAAIINASQQLAVSVVTSTELLLLSGGAASVYTPILANVLNVASTIAYECNYLRIGSIVIVSGKISIKATSASTYTVVSVTLPIASNFSAQENCGGTIVSMADIGVTYWSGGIYADAANNKAYIKLYPPATGTYDYSFVFQYKII